MRLLFSLFLAILSPLALAQSAYPAKPVKIVVPVTTGGPSDLVARLNAELVKILGSEEIRKRFEDMGLTAKASAPDEFGRFLQSEMTRWKGLLVKKP